MNFSKILRKTHLLCKNNRYFFSKSKKQCYYKILNVSSDATLDEIKQQYLFLAKKFHPDVSEDPSQNERFKEISEAYNILSNLNKRKKYDIENGIFQSYQTDKAEKEFENEENYQEFTKMKSADLKTKTKEDEELFKYFQNKYFKNSDYFTIHSNEEDPFNVSEKLIRTRKKHQEENEKKYKIYFPFTFKAYYEKKEMEQYENTRSILLFLLWDFRYPIVFSFFAIGFYAFFDALQEKNKEKAINVKRTFVKEGSGVTVKTLPFNIV